jgi:hypothetical protein
MNCSAQGSVELPGENEDIGGGGGRGGTGSTVLHMLRMNGCAQGRVDRRFSTSVNAAFEANTLKGPRGTPNGTGGEGGREGSARFAMLQASLFDPDECQRGIQRSMGQGNPC